MKSAKPASPTRARRAPSAAAPQAGAGQSVGIAPCGPARLRIGRVTGAHGLHGALRFKPDNPRSEILPTIQRVWLERDGSSREFRLIGVTRLGAGSLRIMLEGIGDAAAADALKGSALAVAVADLPPAGPREFYYFQAVGCDVLTSSGERIGTVAEVFSNGAHEVFTVRDGAREILVPVIDDIVRDIDLGARRITIEAVPGLLD